MAKARAARVALVCAWLACWGLGTAGFDVGFYALGSVCLMGAFFVR